jgi:response regulator RpfG family c-di-GMP phosphodiesterase
MDTSKQPAILVVDDESEILYSLRGLLRKEYDFHAAQSGYEALKVLERTPIHVVMADQRMPEMTGVDFLAQVRTRYPDITRLLLTGYADLPAVIAAINQGQVFRYITKPWDADALRLVLREAVEQHEQLAEGRRLMTDLSAYLRRCVGLLNGLGEGKRGTLDLDARTEAEQLAQGGTGLLGRIGQALVPGQTAQ